MAHIYLISGPCGCGKSTVARALASHLSSGQQRQVYLIHGDNFHAGFACTPGGYPVAPWPQILDFNWVCILNTAQEALMRGMDVIIDYVVEEELPRVQALADRCAAELHYTVLTASEEAIAQRLQQRGDPELTERAIFLRQKLNALPENQGRLLDTTGCTPEEVLQRLLPLLNLLPLVTKRD